VCDGGKILFTRSDMPEAEFRKIRQSTSVLAPFKTGDLEKSYTYADGNTGKPRAQDLP